MSVLLKHGWVQSNCQDTGLDDLKLVGTVILCPKGDPPKQAHPKLYVKVSEPADSERSVKRKVVGW